jgi:hypothetical protein
LNAFLGINVPKLIITRINPSAAPAIPYCTGATYSGFYLTFNVAGGYNLPAGNVYRAEISNIYGQFDNPLYPGNIIASYRYQGNTGSFLCILSDNLQLVPTDANGTTPRYRIRLINAAGEQSANLGEIADVQVCEPTALFLNYTPERKLQRGKDLNLQVIKENVISFNANNRIIVQLSDSLGNFEPADSLRQPLVTLKDTALTLSGAGAFVKQNIRVTIPANTPKGLRYRIRVRSTDPDFTGTTTGTEYIINDDVISGVGDAILATSAVSIYPNPSSSVFNVRVKGAEDGKAELIDLSGRLVSETKLVNGEAQLDVSALKVGLYLVRIHTAIGTVTQKVSRQ